jgi:phosphate transport system permease protein
MAENSAVRALSWFPKEDGVVAVDKAGRVAAVQLTAAHPEASPRSLFGKIWYEGATRPQFVWQSSSGTDDYEPKFSLVPLVFGTLKTTIVGLLLAIPLALGAALYTSEFMAPRWRGVVKPTIEIMAALPSVVVGFLAALVLAPWIQTHLTSVVGATIAVPAVVILIAQGRSILPYSIATRCSRWRIGILALGTVLAMLVSPAVGRWLERYLFAGDLVRWLDGQIGTPWAGWWGLFLLPSALGIAWWASRAEPVSERAEFESYWGSRMAGLMQWFREPILVALGAVALASVCASFLSWIGADLRGSVIGTYTQRNAAVAGLALGFAVIPIVFTVAEDALTAVPVHLRLASLSAGATPWQTTVRIVMPSAASGLFSAVMIGLGRAIGETMIVLMVAGNTPLLELNIFSGARTLSANIAVEMPEAVVNSTHYRILFFSALLLMVITVAINTVAEWVRARTRARLQEL